MAQPLILYVGRLGPTELASFRRWAMERLGNNVVEFDTGPYVRLGGALAAALRTRLLAGPVVSRINRDLLEAVRYHRPDIVWFDKALYFRRRTIALIRAEGAYTVHYNADNPFGPRHDPGWRLFLEALAEYDLHAVPRAGNMPQYRAAGARDVALMPFAYEPTIHFPPPESWSDADRLFDVIFIGSPYDQRPAFLHSLFVDHGIRACVWGDERWRAALPRESWKALVRGGERWNADYRETIWRARICLSFVTHSNCDEIAHRSVEIAGCGGFLMAEDTAGHRVLFADGEEAVLFNSVEDCAAKIRRYLADEVVRTRIARAGNQRAVRDGYGNDVRIGRVLAHIELQRRFRR